MIYFYDMSHHAIISYGCSRTDKPVAPALILHLARLGNELHVGNVIISSVILLCLKIPVTGFHLRTWTSFFFVTLKKSDIFKSFGPCSCSYTILILIGCFSFSFDLLNHHLGRQLNQPTVSHC